MVVAPVVPTDARTHQADAAGILQGRLVGNQAHPLAEGPLAPTQIAGRRAAERCRVDKREQTRLDIVEAAELGGHFGCIHHTQLAGQTAHHAVGQHRGGNRVWPHGAAGCFPGNGRVALRRNARTTGREGSHPHSQEEKKKGTKEVNNRFLHSCRYR